MATTSLPTQAPNDQYIALQSLATQTVEAAQTGRLASLVNLDIQSVVVKDPEPPRKLPDGWKRATPEDGYYKLLQYIKYFRSHAKIFSPNASRD